jgi:hypothetical protein
VPSYTKNRASDINTGSTTIIATTHTLFSPGSTHYSKLQSSKVRALIEKNLITPDGAINLSWQ